MINYEIKKVNKNGEEKETIEVDVNFGYGTVAVYNIINGDKGLEIVNADKGDIGERRVNYNGTDKTLKINFKNVNSLDRFINYLFELRKVMTK